MDDRRSTPRAVAVVLVAVLVGLGLGRFVLAGEDEGPTTRTTTVAAAADLSTRIAQLEDAVASDPEDVRSLQALSAAYVQRATETGDASFYALARSALDRAEDLEPDDVGTLMARGQLSLALHEFDDALEAGTRAREQQPDSAAALGVVVDAQVELGRYDDAAETLQAMLDRDPGLSALARTSYQRELRGDLDGAVAAMRAALGASGTSPAEQGQVAALLGGLLLQTGDVAAARGSYADALRLAPGFHGARVGAARVQAAAGEVDAAVQELTRLSQEQPTVESLVLLEALQRATGDTAGAASTASVVRALAQLQEEAGQVVDLEMALYEADAGDPQQAVRLARAAHAARPDNVFADDALGWALLRSGDVAGAREHAEEAVRLGTRAPAVRWHAAEAAAAAGDAAAAREHLGVALASAPWAPSVDVPAVVALAGRLQVPVPAAWTAAAS